METTLKAQQEGVCFEKWQQRLASVKHLALFFWRALSFQQNAIAGLAVWFLIHISLWLLLAQDASVLCVTGNFLLLSSLALVLCSVASSFGNFANNEWTERDEQAFNGLCARLAEFEHTLCVLWNATVRSRQSKPLKFYACGVALAGTVLMLDQVVSATFVLQCAVCCLLLLPVGLSKGQLHRLSYEDVVKQLLERMQ
ncbi:hypothetical protein EMCRGX_G027476 [Ephydatia muelleri]|eukprot:Em0020g1076a